VAGGGAPPPNSLSFLGDKFFQLQLPFNFQIGMKKHVKSKAKTMPSRYNSYVSHVLFGHYSITDAVSTASEWNEIG
jgi:hypothetical protein